MRTELSKLLKATLIVGIVICCFSCSTNSKQVQKQTDNTKNISITSFNDQRFKTIIIDSCEYILYECEHYNGHGGVWTSGLAHKANCKFCRKAFLK